MKTFVQLSASGIVGLLLLKLLGAYLVPLLGMAFGLLALMFKVLLFVGVAWLLYSIFKKGMRSRDHDDD